MQQRRIERADKRKEQQPKAVTENENFKLLWDFIIQFDRVIQARRQDIVVVDKESKEAKTDFAVPGDSRVKEKRRKRLKSSRC